LLLKRSLHGASQEAFLSLGCALILLAVAAKDMDDGLTRCPSCSWMPPVTVLPGVIASFRRSEGFAGRDQASVYTTALLDTYRIQLAFSRLCGTSAVLQ
jgi:hypothetical protein